MKIAIDFDKTLFDCNSRLYQIVNSLTPSLQTNTLYYTPLSHIKKKDNLITKLYHKLFFFTHAEEYSEYLHALRSINMLKRQGHDITILSSRPPYQLTIMAIKDLIKIYNIDENNIIISCSNKVKFCKQYNIDLIIDNDIKICKKAIQEGIDAICFNNRKFDNIKTSHSWDTVLRYISEVENQKTTQKIKN